MGIMDSGRGGGGRVTAVLTGLLLAGSAGAQGVIGREGAVWPVDASVIDESGFRFTLGARASLIELWRSSSEAKVERVACIGGERANGVTTITRVDVLEGQQGDSMQVQAVASIERCNPPEWLGTVHTHIAKYDGDLPYSTFSGADRGVIAQWHRTWRTEGVFCILFSDVQAHCEAGYDRSGDAAYAQRYGSGPPRP